MPLRDFRKKSGAFILRGGEEGVEIFKNKFNALRGKSGGKILLHRVDSATLAFLGVYVIMGVSEQ